MVRAILSASLALAAPAPQDPGAHFLDKEYQAAYAGYQRELAQANTHRDKLDFGAGTSAYKTENYKKAAEHLGRAILSESADLSAKAYYNLGNTFFQLGKASEDTEETKIQWNNAITHYQEAEQLGTDIARRAAHNRRIVEEKLKALEEPPQEQPPQEQPPQEQPPQQGDTEDKPQQDKPQQGDSQDEETPPSPDQGDDTKLPTGDVQSMDQGEGTEQRKQTATSAYELTPEGKLSEAAARALLESLESEEVKIRPRAKSRHQVLRDW